MLIPQRAFFFFHFLLIFIWAVGGAGGGGGVKGLKIAQNEKLQLHLTLAAIFQEKCNI